MLTYLRLKIRDCVILFTRLRVILSYIEDYIMSSDNDPLTNTTDDHTIIEVHLIRWRTK